MNNLKILSFIALFTLLFTACEKDLDTVPLQNIRPETAVSDDFAVKAVLNGAYDRLSDRRVLGGDMLMITDLFGADGRLNFFGTFNNLRDITNKEVLFNNSNANLTWIRAYSVINQANTVLSALDVVNSEDKERVEGEALFLRAIMHFNLVQLYGKPYSDGNASSNLGVMIMTEPVLDESQVTCISRNTVSEVYTSVVNDLTKATSKVPVSNGVFVNKATVNGFLARVYLQMEDYQNALTAVNNAIDDSSAYTLVANYADAFAQDDNTSEDIFAIQVSSGDGTNGMHTFYAPASVGGRSDVRFSTNFINSFQVNDSRVDMIDDSGFAEKWFNQFGNVNIMRLAELYLVRAECNLRLSSSVGDTPLNDFNKVYFRARGVNATSVVLEDVLQERVFEFFAEGLYLYDQKRLKRDIDGLSYDSDKLVFPIPTSMMTPCPNTVQNPGYSN